MTRKYDTLIHLDNYGNKQESADDSSGRGCLPLPPSLSLQGDMGVGEPHSLLAMYVSAEKQTLDHIWYRGRAHQKNQHMVNFQTMENKLVGIYSSRDEDA